MQPSNFIIQQRSQPGQPKINEGETLISAALDSSKIAYSHLIFNPVKSTGQVAQHCKEVFEAVLFLEGLTERIKSIVSNKIQPLRLQLGGPNSNNIHKKTLYLDLDETLIKASIQPNPILNSSFVLDGITIWYAIRPHVMPFLQRLSNSFELVLFTTAVAGYANFFFQLLNQQTGGLLSHFLHRDHCVHIYKGTFLKPLELVKDRQLSKVLLLDNSAVSFGFNLDNGIPVTTWRGDPNDCQLPFISEYLQKLSQAEDVRIANRQHLNLRGIIMVSKSSLLAD